MVLHTSTHDYLLLTGYDFFKATLVQPKAGPPMIRMVMGSMLGDAWEFFPHMLGRPSLNLPYPSLKPSLSVS
jgi:hypothetical protein